MKWRIAVVMTVWCTVAAAQDQDLPVTVTGVQGNVQVREGEDQAWQKAMQGMKLSVGAEFRTGPKSAVRFFIPPDQTVTLDRLGVIKVLTALQQADGKLKTDLGMTYGRTRYKIEVAGIEHASQIKTPSMNLTVRGSEVGAQEDFLGVAWCNTHMAYFNGLDRPEVDFGAGTEVSENHRRPTDRRLHVDEVDAKSDPSRQNTEQGIIIDHPQGLFDLNSDGPGDFRDLQRLADGMHTTTVRLEVE